MKPRTKADKIDDCFTAFECIRDGKPVKRSGAKDGSIATKSVVPVPDLLESQVMVLCKNWLKQHRIMCNRNNTGTGQIGISGVYSYGIKDGGDLIGLLPSGTHFEIELKRGRGGRLSKGQQKRMQDVRANNGLYFVVHGVEELIYYFKGLV